MYHFYFKKYSLKIKISFLAPKSCINGKSFIPLHSQNGNGGIAQLVRASDS